MCPADGDLLRGGMGGNVANCKEVAPSAFSDFEISKFLSMTMKIDREKFAHILIALCP
jgi:hypothetical protein